MLSEKKNSIQKLQAKEQKADNKSEIAKANIRRRKEPRKIDYCDSILELINLTPKDNVCSYLNKMEDV